MNSNNINSSDDIKEPFCGACALIPLAFAGAGASAYGNTSKGHKKTKKILLWSGVITVILCLIFIIYIYGFKKCTECR
jgi:cytosine/uracil/thiamine/allantoin permease